MEIFIKKNELKAAMPELQEQFITKDMILGDVVEKYPETAALFLNYGLHCVGCHANVWDTVSDGAKVHGLSDEEIEQMVTEINVELAKARAGKAELKGEPEKNGAGNGALSEDGNVSENGIVLSLTPDAVSKIKDIQQKEGKVGYGLRVSVMPGGCAGFQYGLDFEPEATSEDMVLEHNGVKVFIDPESAEMIRGTTIDYLETLQQTGFKINNPNAKKSCGCGNSFG